MKKAIIFDFDGTIIDTESAWYQGFITFLKDAYNYDITLQEFLTLVGTSNEKFVKAMNTTYDKHISVETFNHEVYKIVAETADTLMPLPGVLDILKKSKQARIPVVIASSSKRDHIVHHVKRLGLESYFDHIICANDVDAIKPSPDLFNLALEKLGVTAAEAIIFEDSNHGLSAGNAARVDVILVPNALTKHSDFSGKWFDKLDSLETFAFQDYFSGKKSI